VLRNNDDFYMPTFSQKMECAVGYMLRITRLAKCMSEKFAPRCYDAVGVAVAFVAQDVVEKNCALGRPCDEAYCFDKSIALSPECITPVELESGKLGVRIGNAEFTKELSHLQLSLDGALARASELLTLKTGDIVFIAATTAERVAIGDRVEIALNEKQLLDFVIK
jgi:hypothetical protein